MARVSPRYASLEAVDDNLALVLLQFCDNPEKIGRRKAGRRRRCTAAGQDAYPLPSRAALKGLSEPSQTPSSRTSKTLPPVVRKRPSSPRRMR